LKNKKCYITQTAEAAPSAGAAPAAGDATLPLFSSGFKFFE